MPSNANTTVSIYAARAADRNPRAMQGALELGGLIAKRFNLDAHTVAAPETVHEGGWESQLRVATPTLTRLAAHLDNIFAQGGKGLLINGRCAASIATLPVLAQRHPDAVLVWFDAHGDINTPADQNFNEFAYLGGMVITGACGHWDTGLGAGLDFSRVVLAGCRDLDPPEVDKIRSGQITLVESGNGFAQRLLEAIGGRPIYVHLDCDVISAGLVPTEYQVPDGIDFAALKAVFEALSQLRVIGLEVAEYEGVWPDGRSGDVNALLDAITPLVRAVAT
ncbi:MAG: arginase family protein [Proteobacteria bacterium]|nr:arginase family protein [Pseudomonadota bacterium]MCA0200043.1 arginase family protein [Pseudomonadota bacterium]